MALKSPRDEPVFICFDGGNSLWKAIRLTARRVKEDIKFGVKEYEMPHAMTVSGSAEFDGIKRRLRGSGVGDVERFRVDGQAYTVGMSAEAAGVITRATGAAKYRRDYYGVSLMAMLINLLPKGHDNVYLYATFPPGDVAHVDALVDSVIGKWKIETSGGGTLEYKIRSVQPVDEPVGGWLRVGVDINGQSYTESEFTRGSTLVIDIGGKISSVLRVLPPGRPQYGMAVTSIDLGMQDVEARFVSEMRSEFPQLAMLRALDGGLVREAIASGRYLFKGAYLDCQAQVDRASASILNQLNTYYVDRYGAGANDYQILVTGGGGAALFGLLREALGHQRMFIADKFDEMHFANVRGVMQFARGKILSGAYGKLGL